MGDSRRIGADAVLLPALRRYPFHSVQPRRSPPEMQPSRELPRGNVLYCAIDFDPWGEPAIGTPSGNGRDAT